MHKERLGEIQKFISKLSVPATENSDCSGLEILRHRVNYFLQNDDVTAAMGNEKLTEEALILTEHDLKGSLASVRHEDHEEYRRSQLMRAQNREVDPKQDTSRIIKSEKSLQNYLDQSIVNDSSSAAEMAEKEAIERLSKKYNRDFSQLSLSQREKLAYNYMNQDAGQEDLKDVKAEEVLQASAKASQQESVARLLNDVREVRIDPPEARPTLQLEVGSKGRIKLDSLLDKLNESGQRVCTIDKDSSNSNVHLGSRPRGEGSPKLKLCENPPEEEKMRRVRREANPVPVDDSPMLLIRQQDHHKHKIHKKVQLQIKHNRIQSEARQTDPDQCESDISRGEATNGPGDRRLTSIEPRRTSDAAADSAYEAQVAGMSRRERQHRNAHKARAIVRPLTSNEVEIEDEHGLDERTPVARDKLLHSRMGKSPYGNAYRAPMIVNKNYGQQHNEVNVHINLVEKSSRPIQAILQKSTKKEVAGPVKIQIITRKQKQLIAKNQPSLTTTEQQDPTRAHLKLPNSQTPTIRRARNIQQEPRAVSQIARQKYKSRVGHRILAAGSRHDGTDDNGSQRRNAAALHDSGLETPDPDRHARSVAIDEEAARINEIRYKRAGNDWANPRSGNQSVAYYPS